MKQDIWVPSDGLQAIMFGFGLTKELQNYLHNWAIHKKMADIFNTVFAKKTMFTISIVKPGNTVIKSKVSH